jgi:hypothetical protein
VGPQRLDLGTRRLELGLKIVPLDAQTDQLLGERLRVACGCPQLGDLRCLPLDVLDELEGEADAGLVVPIRLTLLTAASIGRRGGCPILPGQRKCDPVRPGGALVETVPNRRLGHPAQVCHLGDRELRILPQLNSPELVTGLGPASSVRVPEKAA